MNRRDLNLVVTVALIAGLSGGALSAILLHAGAVIAQETKPTPNIIRAEGFEVVKDGKKYVELSVSETLAGLTVYRKNGDKSAQLMGGEDGSVLALHRRKTGLIVLTAVGTVLSMDLLDGGTKQMARLMVTPGTSSLNLSGSKDTSALLAVGYEGYGHLTLSAEGQMRTRVGSIELKTTETDVRIERPMSSIALFNKKGNVVWQAP